MILFCTWCTVLCQSINRIIITDAPLIVQVNRILLVLTAVLLCKVEVTKSRDPNKIMSSSDVFCQLLQSADTNTVKKCLVQLSIFLCHKFPRVRKSTAEKMYEALLTFTENEIVPGKFLHLTPNHFYLSFIARGEFGGGDGAVE